MDLDDYQRAACKTLQPGWQGADGLIVPLLGLVGEAGSIATAYKKQLRDGQANPTFKARLREELGDILWYVAALSEQAGLDLADIAAANLHKVADRWRPSDAGDIPFDEGYPLEERLPRTARFDMKITEEGGVTTSILTCDGQQVGDPLTDASHVRDGYLMHDVFHLSYAAVLGWSPVIRSLMHRKRRSNPAIDEAEDGGRAIAIEEGISALMFSYASRHNYFNGIDHVDTAQLDVIAGMVCQLEVSVHRAADWEKAILTGFAAWRQLRRQSGGIINLDMANQTLTVSSRPWAPTG